MIDTHVFWKNRNKATKAVAGAVFNFGSRVLAGVLAGVITSHVMAPETDEAGIKPVPAVAAAVIGATVN